MCARPGARSVAGMTRRTIGLVAAAGAAAATLGAAGAAQAAAIYGGSTHDGEAIVLTTDAAATTLKTATISYHADCGDKGMYSVAGQYTIGKPQPGFSPGQFDLIASKNAKGSFAAKQLVAQNLGDHIAVIAFNVQGKLKGTRASGTLSATVTVSDMATRAVAGTCATGTVRWAAARAPGTIFGGATSQDEPVVLRVSGRKISDLMFGWSTHSCAPDATHSYSYPEQLSNFKLGSSGAFKGAFTYPVTFGDGTKRTFDYRLGGTVGATKAKGTIAIKFTDTDAAGAQTQACDSGPLTFKATTG